jgi:hypothetical protein
LAHGFKGFRSWSIGSIVSGLLVRQNIMVGSVWQSKVTSLAGLEAGPLCFQIKKGAGSKFIFPRHVPIDLLPPLGLRLPIVPSRD